MKDLSAQQSRFKWMMEGNCSPDTSSPENLYHKNVHGLQDKLAPRTHWTQVLESQSWQQPGPHGPLLTFHLGLTPGTALIRYGSKQEAAKAQSALHMLGELGAKEPLQAWGPRRRPLSGWQSLDSTGSSSDPSATQGPGLGIFTQWSSNGAGVGGAGGVEAGRQVLWGGIGGVSGAGYPSGGGSLWASPALEDRHQMGSPASLLPGDLLGGSADSI
ncbi:hypothetical protein XENOCAPTIV_015019 [Xenoophorus captivus]|uniref:Uncharacterized protein n=1 Tax=Xenoophorus captivus TaxID=1517983 RepID=A0ABV0QWR7_9TELE